LAGLATASLAVTATSCGGGGTSGSFDDTVTVGILHSLSGTMAISESTLVDTEKMAIEEINAAGGVTVGGKSYKIEYIVEDGASDWPTFAEKSKKLIDQDGVPVVFGGWTSASRKAMLPVYESKDAFLYYPIQYEAQECSNNIFYTGATPNQQSEPATDFMYKRSPAAGGDFFLVGSDYVFPRTSNTITKAQVAQLGGLRAAAQSISYEIPLALSVLAIVLMTNSLSTVDIVNQQSGAGILSWNIWRQPVGFIVFWICALAECERLPFDLPEAEEELVAGYQTEYAGMKFALFYLGSYINLILSALLVSILYLGGWGFPIPVELIAKFLNLPINAPFIQVFTASIGIVMTVLKAYLLVFIAILLRWTTPRVRIDQLLDLGWKFLLPISLANLLLTAGLKLAFPQFFGG